MMIGSDHPLYGVKDVFNAIFINGNMVDDLMFYGRGAGKLPTASAVVADVIDAARNLGNTKPIIWSKEKLELGNVDDFEHAFFVRVPSDTDEEALKTAFGEINLVKLDEIKDEFAFITPIMKEKVFQNKIKDFKSVMSVIRLNAK
jgi:homoserine dehydrogenase